MRKKEKKGKQMPHSWPPIVIGGGPLARNCMQSLQLRLWETCFPFARLQVLMQKLLNLADWQ